jgi:hypothetical protein
MNNLMSEKRFKTTELIKNPILTPNCNRFFQFFGEYLLKLAEQDAADRKTTVKMDENERNQIPPLATELPN